MRASGRARNLSLKARETGAGDQQATRSTGRVRFREFGERHEAFVEENPCFFFVLFFFGGGWEGG